MELPGAHPTNWIADRISELERRGFPDVMVWKPQHSISGKWEADGDGWDEPIVEADPVTFAARLETRLQPVRPEGAGGR